MFLPSFRRIAGFALAFVGVALTAGSSVAQQGWPYNPDAGSGRSISPRFVIGVSPSMAAPAAQIAAAMPVTVQFQLQVPVDAKIWFDGQPTMQSGAARTFVSSPLTPGAQYSYVVRVAWHQSDLLIERARSITFKAGDQVNLDFTTPALTTSR